MRVCVVFLLLFVLWLCDCVGVCCGFGVGVLRFVVRCVFCLLCVWFAFVVCFVVVVFLVRYGLGVMRADMCALCVCDCGLLCVWCFLCLVCVIAFSVCLFSSCFWCCICCVGVSLCGCL